MCSTALYPIHVLHLGIGTTGHAFLHYSTLYSKNMFIQSCLTYVNQYGILMICSIVYYTREFVMMRLTVLPETARSPATMRNYISVLLTGNTEISKR